MVIKDRLRRVVGFASNVPILGGGVMVLYDLWHRKQPWMHRHPFDRAYGTVTRGMVPPWLMPSGSAADHHSTVYAGCQPSCLRQALAALPHASMDISAPRFAASSFVDLGCGKGRAAIIASEWPFHRIIGIELAPRLVRQARRNAALIRARYPARAPIEIVQGDATTVPLPDGDLVLFLYHSFDAALVTQMLNRIVRLVGHNDRVCYLIYENPVYGGLVDMYPQANRWFCQTVRCDVAERGLAPEDEDTVVIWRLARTQPSTPPAAAAQAIIVVDKPGWRASLRVVPPPEP